MNNQSFFWSVVFFVSIFLLVIFLNISESYWTLYWAMFFTLLCSTKLMGVTIKFLAYFFIVYLGLALLDISNYRGSIDIVTLRLYCQMILLIFFGIYFLELFVFRKLRFIKKPYQYQSAINTKQKNLVIAHLTIVYLMVIYVYLTKGWVIFNQDLRFLIPTSIAYVIKSSIYIPLIYWSSRGIKNKFGFYTYIVFPLLPAVLIGSRGTVIMTLLGLVLIQMLQSINSTRYTNAPPVKFSPKFLLWILSLGGGMVYLLYYIRRMTPNSNFLSPSEALNMYFYSDSWFGYLVMPLHLGFKETLGLTNLIVTKQLDNIYTNVPLFFIDLLTVLPGKQLGAGEAMASMFGTVAAGGLTPGIMGGLYVDFMDWSIAIIFIIVVVLYLFELLARFSDKWLVIYALSLVQFIHLFHRGFIKPEYLFAYIIVIIYLKSGSFYTRKK